MEKQALPNGGLAVVIGASGAIGGAVFAQLEAGGEFEKIIGLSRRGRPALDITSEVQVAEAALLAEQTGMPLRLVFNATGFLHSTQFSPEKSLRQIDPEHMARAFAVNTIGPALLMKHFLPLLAREGKSVFATLSAKVGSIGDNRLGGWYSYRASKAALNQLVKTAAIELKRRHPEAVVVALHPGTVASGLSQPFRADGLTARAPEAAARKLLDVINRLSPEASGSFFDLEGNTLPW